MIDDKEMMMIRYCMFLVGGVRLDFEYYEEALAVWEGLGVEACIVQVTE